MDTPAEDVPVHKSGKLDRSDELFIVQAVFMSFSATCVLIRAYVKCFIVKANMLEDYLIYSAMVAYVVYSAVVMDGCTNGALGKHPSLDISTDQAALGLRAWYITMVLYPWITLTVRAAVCVLLFRLTHHTKRGLPWFIRAVFVASTLSSVAFFFVLLLQCTPPRYFWTTVYGESGRCYDRLIVDNTTVVYSTLSVLFDWCLGLLPIAILWSVQINRRTKVAIAGLLSLGVIAGIAIIVRTTYVTRLGPGLRFLYEAIDVAIWSVMEPALGIIASCLATFRPLFKGCGFGLKPSKQHTACYQLPELHHDGAFKPASDIPEVELGPKFDLSKDDDKRYGSERDLVSC